LNLSYLTICVLIPDGPKPRTKKSDQSSRNRHSPQTSVHELSLRLQRHQFHSEPREPEYVQTRTIPTSSTTRELYRLRHPARADFGHSTAQVVLNKLNRGGSSGVDEVDRLVLTSCCRSNFIVWPDRRLLTHAHTIPMHPYSFPLALIIFLHSALIIGSVNAETVEQVAVQDFFNRNVSEASESLHTNNWAVLVCASRYWFNYRVRIVGLLYALSCA